ncbi:MAG: acetyltransferase [Sphingobacteriaceae bacterium]|nr:acetyltransferase [Sphingobacteriaceae bacterium]
MRNLIIIGASDFALEVWSWLKQAKGYGVEFVFKGFLDDNPNALLKCAYYNSELLGNVSDYVIQSNDVFVCAIGSPLIKEKLTKSISEKGGEFINLIHENVIMLNHVKLGVGIIITPNCIVSNDCVIGNHVAINFNCTLGHNVSIGNYCQISSHCDLTGYVSLGDRVFLGSGVSIIPKVKITNNVVLGAGCVVFTRIAKEGTYIGNPAKRIDF